MSQKYKIHNPGGVYFVTLTVIDWIDVFIRNEYRAVVIDSIKYCQRNKGLEVYAYCFMTSHVHLIIAAKGKLPLEGIIRDLKAFTSRHIRKLLEANDQVFESRHWILRRMCYVGSKNNNNIDFQFWQQHSHPIELTTPEMIEQKIDYVHNNPVKAGFVSAPESWTYSSAADYFGLSKGLIDLVFI